MCVCVYKYVYYVFVFHMFLPVLHLDFTLQNLAVRNAPFLSISEFNEPFKMDLLGKFNLRHFFVPLLLSGPSWAFCIPVHCRHHCQYICPPLLCPLKRPAASMSTLTLGSLILVVGVYES